MTGLYFVLSFSDKRRLLVLSIYLHPPFAYSKYMCSPARFLFLVESRSNAVSLKSLDPPRPHVWSKEIEFLGAGMGTDTAISFCHFLRIPLMSPCSVDAVGRGRECVPTLISGTLYLLLTSYLSGDLTIQTYLSLQSSCPTTYIVTPAWIWCYSHEDGSSGC